MTEPASTCDVVLALPHQLDSRPDGCCAGRWGGGAMTGAAVLDVCRTVRTLTRFRGLFVCGCTGVPVDGDVGVPGVMLTPPTAGPCPPPLMGRPIPDAHKELDMYEDPEEPGGTTMKLPSSSVVEYRSRFWFLAPRDATELPSSRAMSMSCSSRSSSIMSSTGLLALDSSSSDFIGVPPPPPPLPPPIAELPGLFELVVPEVGVPVALPKNIESEMSASFLENAPRMADARALPSGCCFKNRFSANADLLCAWLSTSSEFANATSLSRAEAPASRNDLAACACASRAFFSWPLRLDSDAISAARLASSHCRCMKKRKRERAERRQRQRKIG